MDYSTSLQETIVASISPRRRADGTTAWRVQFRLDGVSTPTSETFDQHEDALVFAGLVDRVGGTAARRIRATPTIHQVTIGDALEDYISSAPDLADATASDYRRMLDRSGISSRLGGIPVDALARTDIEAWVKARTRMVSERTGRPPAPKTIANEHGLLSTILAHAVARGWAASNPAAGVRLPRQEAPEIEIMSTSAFLALHAAMVPQHRPLVWLLGATGLRWGEATALHWRDVEDDAVMVRQAWKHDDGAGRTLGATKTRTSRRRVETAPEVIEQLGPRGRPDALVFVNSEGRRVQHATFYECHWDPAVRRAGISPRPTVHELRHFAASYMLSQGADIFEVSRALGHASIVTTTRVYGHLVPSRTRPTVRHAVELQAALTARLSA